MKPLLAKLASLKLAVILLILSLFALAAATIVESAAGTETAGRTVYYALWFQLLMGLFTANIVASIATLYPWGKRRLGFLMTHGALVLIVAGSAVTYLAKTEGQLALREGESASRFEQVIGTGPTPATVPHDLPFTVTLKDFQIDYYQGTMRPAMFRSKVEVADPGTSKSFPFDIQMNQELAFHGWRLFQSSYQQQDGREMTVLTVSKDPGEPIVFIGYVLLLIGMCTVLATRISQVRASGMPGSGVSAPKPMTLRARASASAMVLLLLGLANSIAHAAEPADTLRRLPVQHDGRVMPLDTLARETVLNISGQRAWQGMDPVDLVLKATADPQAWADLPLVKLGSGDLARAAGWPGQTTHASFHQLVSNQPVLQLMQEARQHSNEDKPLHGVLKDAQKLDGRLSLLQQLLERQLIRPIPDPNKPTDQWGLAPGGGSADELRALMTGTRPAAWPNDSAIQRELRYNAMRPTRLAWWFLGAALLLSVLAWNLGKRWLDGLAVIGLVFGFAIMTWGIATRWAIAGRIPASNIFESLLFLGWGIGLFALIAYLVLRNRIVVVNAAAMATITMMLTDLLPIDGFIHPMPPVLSGTPWLAIHVPIIMTSYAVLALGVVFAHMQIGFTIFAPKRKELISKMSELLYFYTHVGSILLIAGIITGSVWAAGSWGRYWGWDPKEVWSLVAFVAYVAILHARWDQLLGKFGVAAWSIVAFQTILMTYLGVNFVLAMGLHSYGFGGSSVVQAMIAVAVAEALFIGWGWWADRKRPSFDGPTAVAGLSR
ncbi:MAG: cytochrome c biogenesis protein CcsA [Acidobacteriota bacterium]